MLLVSCVHNELRFSFQGFKLPPLQTWLISAGDWNSLGWMLFVMSPLTVYVYMDSDASEN